MHSRSRKLAGVVAILALIASSGCVSRGRYDRLATERDEFSQRIAALESKNADLSHELSASRAEVGKLRGTYDQLVAELESEVAAGQVQIRNLVDGIHLDVSDALLFPSGSARLDAAGRDVLRRVAGRIKQERAIVSVVGHTDNVMISASLRGRYPTNWELAGARAASVAKQLSAQGLDPARLRAVSRGPFDPIASNETAQGRAKNRRTEIILRPLPALQ